MCLIDSEIPLSGRYSNLQVGFAALIGFCGYVLVAKLRSWARPNLSVLPPFGKAVLITGADTGFGALTSVRLAELGYCVFAACLNAEKAAKSPQFVATKKQYPDTFHAVQMDITNAGEIERAKEVVVAWLEATPHFRLYGIFNNAGIAYPLVPLELYSMEAFNRILDVNVFGTVRVVKEFTSLIRQGIEESGEMEGRIVIMSSLAGELSCPLLGAYCSSKWALIAIGDALRYELHPFGIKVSLILPDLYRTDLVTNKAANHVALQKEIDSMEPTALKAYGGKATERMHMMIELMESNASPNLEPVIDAIVDAVRSHNPKRKYYPISWKSSLLTCFGQWFPSLLDNLVKAGQRCN